MQASTVPTILTTILQKPSLARYVRCFKVEAQFNSKGVIVLVEADIHSCMRLFQNTPFLGTKHLTAWVHNILIGDTEAMLALACFMLPNLTKICLDGFYKPGRYLSAVIASSFDKYNPMRSLQNLIQIEQTKIGRGVAKSSRVTRPFIQLHLHVSSDLLA